MIYLLKRYAMAVHQQVILYLHRAHMRRQLAELTIEQLQDVGLSREKVLVEMDKPFWLA